ncbi:MULTISPECIES: hypothetical protein [Burkholderia]|nr:MULTISPECIES: hypothetical protein [Burkholderia]
MNKKLKKYWVRVLGALAGQGFHLDLQILWFSIEVIDSEKHAA